MHSWRYHFAHFLMLNIQSQYLSAFWLRSSVVSILISLISDIWVISPHDIKKIFNHKFVVVLDISNIMFYKFLSCVHLFFCFSFCDSMMIPSTPSPPFLFFFCSLQFTARTCCYIQENWWQANMHHWSIWAISHNSTIPKGKHLSLDFPFGRCYLIILLFFGWYQKSVTIVFDYLAKVFLFYFLFFSDFRLIYLLSSKMLVRHFAHTLEMV